jgi:hypothetical protein
LWPCIVPKAKEGSRIPRNLGTQIATLGADVPAFINILVNVLAFIGNLGPNNKPKLLKNGPKVFSALTPSVRPDLH